jgi:hypothetical protein
VEGGAQQNSLQQQVEVQAEALTGLLDIQLQVHLHKAHPMLDLVTLEVLLEQAVLTVQAEVEEQVLLEAMDLINLETEELEESITNLAQLRPLDI